MNQDETVIDFLNTCKHKILDFNHKNESNHHFSDLIETNREILKYIQELHNFLTPCLNSNFQRSYKKYEDCVYINRNRNDENEISLILEMIQNETNDVLNFLENLHIIYNSLYYNRYTEDDYKQNKDDMLLEMFNRCNLLKEKVNTIKKVIEDNEIKIKELNNDKLSCKRELEKCVETLNNFKITNSEMNKIQNRLNLYSNLSQYLYL